jgi:hypothetical protein
MASEGARDGNEENGIATEFLFSSPVCDLLRFGQLMGKFPVRCQVNVWHVTRLARGIGWDYPHLARVASTMPFRDRVHFRLHSLGERLLDDQIRTISLKERLFGIIPLGNANLGWVNDKERIALSKSLLATAIRYRQGLALHNDQDLYAHAMVSHGLKWACVLLERWNKIDSTNLPEGAPPIPMMEPGEVNRAIFQALGVS